MPTASNPEDLVREAEDTLVAARSAAGILAKNPELQPIERMHAGGTDGQGRKGPLLEIQLGDDQLQTLGDWSTKVSVPVSQSSCLSSVTHTAVVDVDGVRLMVTTWTESHTCHDRYGQRHAEHLDNGDGECAYCGADLAYDLHEDDMRAERDYDVPVDDDPDED